MTSKKATILNTSVLIVLLGILSINSVAGAQQWFPNVSTTCEYKVSTSLTLNNGTVMESNLFNIYDYITSYRVVPILIEELAGTTFSGTLLEENVELSVIHTYSEESSTQLRRTTTYKTSTMELSDMSVQFARAFNGTHYNPYTVSTSDKIVDKNNFFTTMTTDFVDHIDSTIGINGEILPGIKVISITPDAIIAFQEGGYNISYTCGRDGLVDQFTNTVDVTLQNQDVAFSGLVFSQWSAMTFFDWPWDWIFGLSSLVLLIIVILVARSKRK